MNLKYLVILFSLCGTQIGAQEKPKEYYFGVLEKFSGKGDGSRIDVKILPTNRIRPFYKVNSYIVANDHIGKRVMLVLSDSEQGRRTSRYHGDYPEHEKALLPLAQYIAEQKMPLVAEEFLARGMRFAESLGRSRRADPSFNGHLIAGRIRCEDELDLEKLASQAQTFQGGYFITMVREPGKNVGFSHPGHFPAEVKVEDVDAVQLVKEVVLRRAGPEQRGGFKARIKLEGGKLLGEGYIVRCFPAPAQNRIPNNFGSGNEAWATMPFTTPVAEFAAGELPPGKYRVHAAPGKPSTMLSHIATSVGFEIEAGKTTDVELFLPTPKLPTLTYVTSTTSQFEAKQVRSRLIFVGAGIGNIFVEKPEDVDDYKLWKNAFSTPRFIRLKGEQLTVRCGGTQKPCYYVGPGPLSNYLDKDLKLEVLSPDNDTGVEYDTNLGSVYFYQVDAINRVMFQVDPPPP